MQTHLAPEFADTPEGQAAEAILRKCVHCGFCTATCPTYQLLGDELDGPRGRIYLMKQVLEGAEVTRSMQEHLDKCLTCRNCESTCPSGVQYGQLVEMGRRIVDAKVQRPVGERLARWALREGLTSPLFPVALKVGQKVRPLLPDPLKSKVPAHTPAPSRAWPTRMHARKVLLLAGCVQPALQPNINLATAQVLDAAEIQTIIIKKATCCGALRSHLSDHDGGLNDARRNIDAWWPLIQSGEVEAIVMNASACGLAVKEYGHTLAHDAAYADKAQHVAALARDVSELLPALVPALQRRLRPAQAGEPIKLAFHPPCTLQHGQKLRGGVETHLAALGFEVHVAQRESHLCCGSAGTYSVLQPKLSRQLRERKLYHLAELQPQVIVSANIGCIQHLQGGTITPVRHWIDVLADRLSPASSTV